jgi:1-acyl-sn-glycerol-3-phosphate acyltransferase
MLSLSSLLRGMLFLLASVLSTAAVCIALFPLVLTLPIHSRRVIRMRHSYMAWISGEYFTFLAILYCQISGTKIVLYTSNHAVNTHKSNGSSHGSSGSNSSSNGSTLLSSKSTDNTLLLCNHRTRIDWIYAGWIYSSLIGVSSVIKFVLKESLRSIPLFGWAMQIVMFIFLSRNRNTDISHMQTAILYLLSCSKRLR